MEDLKVVFASNLIRLRTEAGLTQAQLAEQLNYSDKSVSKWERGEAVPDVTVVKQMATIFGVTVDFLLESHDGWQPEEPDLPATATVSTSVVTAIVQVSIWTLALLLFVIFWLSGEIYWQIFVATAPLSLVTLLVLNSVWGRQRYNLTTVCLLVVSVFGLLYAAIPGNPWQIWLLLAPALAIACLSFFVYRRKRKK